MNTASHCFTQIMKPDAYLIAYGQKTVPQKIDAKYKRNPKNKGQSVHH